MILDFHRQGLTISVIARELGIDRKTVRRCIARSLETPVCGPRQRSMARHTTGVTPATTRFTRGAGPSCRHDPRQDPIV